MPIGYSESFNDDQTLIGKAFQSLILDTTESNNYKDFNTQLINFSRPWLIDSIENTMKSSIYSHTTSLISLMQSYEGQVYRDYNTAIQSQYGVSMKDLFLGILDDNNGTVGDGTTSTPSTVPWFNQFKEGFYRTYNDELVQCIGFASYYPSTKQFVVYPNLSPILASPLNTLNIVSGGGTSSLVLAPTSSISNDASHFYVSAGDYVFAAASTTVGVATYIYSTYVTAVTNYNSINLNKPIGVNYSCAYFVRKPKINQPLELRFSPAAFSNGLFGAGVCAGVNSTGITLMVTVQRVNASNITFPVNIFPDTIAGTGVTNGTIATPGRRGLFPTDLSYNSKYFGVGVAAITVVGGIGNTVNLLNFPAFEIWTTSTHNYPEVD